MQRPHKSLPDWLAVEILDVTEDEPRVLLLTIDPLASLAQQQGLECEALLA